jgi:hypothetical protein
MATLKMEAGCSSNTARRNNPVYSGSKTFSGTIIEMQKIFRAPHTISLVRCFTKPGIQIFTRNELKLHAVLTATVSGESDKLRPQRFLIIWALHLYFVFLCSCRQITPELPNL